MRAVDTAANIKAWQRYAATAATREHPQQGVLPDRLEWTQVPGVGPGEELLGDLTGRRVLELGCGTGATTAFLASRGAHVTAVDAAATQITRALTRWAHLDGIVFTCSDATTYLTSPGPQFDIIISVFGALDFTPPADLLPLIANRIRPGGLLAISTLHPARSRHTQLDRLLLNTGPGPDTRINPEADVTVPISRPLPEPAWWTDALTSCGLTPQIDLKVTLPGEDVPSCLILTATKLNAASENW